MCQRETSAAEEGREKEHREREQDREKDNEGKSVWYSWKYLRLDFFTPSFGYHSVAIFQLFSYVSKPPEAAKYTTTQDDEVSSFSRSLGIRNPGDPQPWAYRTTNERCNDPATIPSSTQLQHQPHPAISTLYRVGIKQSESFCWGTTERKYSLHTSSKRLSLIRTFTSAMEKKEVTRVCSIILYHTKSENLWDKEENREERKRTKERGRNKSMLD